MNSLDYLILGIVLVSAVLGMLRGLVKEILSLCAYIAAFFGALWWGPQLAQWLEPHLANPLARTALAYLLVFIFVLLAVGALNMLVGTLIDRTGLTPADHGLGGLFGVLRGMLIVLALVTLAGHAELSQEPWWQESRLAGPSIQAIQYLKQWLPASVAGWLPY